MYLFHDVIHMRFISAATMRLACLIASDFLLFPFLSLSLSRSQIKFSKSGYIMENKR